MKIVSLVLKPGKIVFDNELAILLAGLASIK